jgi:hypothetical protein
MSFTLRPATRENTPLVVGIAGPTKSGKTYSAHRLARGLAPTGQIAMLNAEGARGHQYADKFQYSACDIEAPYSYKRFTEAVKEIAKQQPACLIVDSMSHAHDGPGGMLEQHDSELDRMAGEDWKKRDKVNFAAWIRPKKDENEFIYTLLGLKCPVILCFRAKEKIKIVPGKQPVDLGWQPIASDRVAFETIFTVMLSPHSKGVPDLAISDLREPFDTLIPQGKPIDESLGASLREWAKGSAALQGLPSSHPSPAGAALISAEQAAELSGLFEACDKKAKAAFLAVAKLSAIEFLPVGDYVECKDWIRRRQAKQTQSAGAPI